MRVEEKGSVRMSRRDFLNIARSSGLAVLGVVLTGGTAAHHILDVRRSINRTAQKANDLLPNPSKEQLDRASATIDDLEKGGLSANSPEVKDALSTIGQNEVHDDLDGPTTLQGIKISADIIVGVTGLSATALGIGKIVDAVRERREGSLD